MKNRLKELRKTRGWSQADLARALKISRQAVNGFESGKFTPSLEMAFKIALLFGVALDSIFIYREKNLMQRLQERVDSFTQWLPRGERFTEEAIAVIEYARYYAGNKQSQVEPEDLLYGLMKYSTVTAGLLTEYNLVLNQEDSTVIELKEATKTTKFSPESTYVLELALNAARLKQSKQIGTEFVLLGLIQLTQVGNNSLLDIFESHEVDLEALSRRVRELQLLAVN